MSIHKSLKLKNSLERPRSVLTRWERIERLLDEEKWREGDNVLGLPKVRTKYKIKSRRLAKREAAEAKKAEQEAEKEAKKSG